MYNLHLMIEAQETTPGFLVRMSELGQSIDRKSSFLQLIGILAVPIVNNLAKLDLIVPDKAVSFLDKLVKEGDSSPWRWLVDKILKHSLDRAFGHAVYFKSKEVSDEGIRHAYKQAFVNPQIFSNKDNKIVIDPAYSMSVAKYPRIIHGLSGLTDVDLAKQAYKKSPIILKLNHAESDSINNTDNISKIKELFKQAPYIIILLEGAEGGNSRSYILSSHFPQDGVVAGSLLQNFTKKLYGKDNAVDVKSVSDADIEAQLKLSDEIETDGNTISESMMITDNEFINLSEDFDKFKEKLEKKNIEIPKSVYIWLRILKILGVDGKSLTASNLRFNHLIREQLNLYNIENIEEIFEKLENNDTNWLKDQDLLHPNKEQQGKYLFGFARQKDVTQDIVGKLLKALPPSEYGKVWELSEMLGILEALIPGMHISTIPVSITIGGMTLEVGGICTTALSKHEKLGMVMMIHENRLIIRWKRVRTNKDK